VQRGELLACLDEKRNTQLLGRVIPDLPLDPGYALRRGWRYVRRGTVNLPLIHNPLTGELRGPGLARNDAGNPIPTLEAYLAELPWKIRCVHCVLDQTSHIPMVTREWVADQEGLIGLHFTPRPRIVAEPSGADPQRLQPKLTARSGERKPPVTDRTCLSLAKRVRSVARTFIHFSGYSQDTRSTNGTRAQLRTTVH
jgi:hypothetical protein